MNLGDKPGTGYLMLGATPAEELERKRLERRRRAADRARKRHGRRRCDRCGRDYSDGLAACPYHDGDHGPRPAA